MAEIGGWVGVDLDGTLAEYTFWRGPHHIGAPIPAMVAIVRDLLDKGTEVRIVTARVAATGRYADTSELDDSLEFARQQAELIGNWTQDVFGQRLQVTAQKDFAMSVLYDDRAIQVEKNTGRLITDHNLIKFTDSGAEPICDYSAGEEDPDGRTTHSYYCQRLSTQLFTQPGNGRGVMFLCDICAERVRSEWSEQSHTWQEYNVFLERRNAKS